MPLADDVVIGIGMVFGPTLDDTTTLYASFLEYLQETAETDAIEGIYAGVAQALVSSDEPIYMGLTSVIGWNNAINCFYQCNSEIYVLSYGVGYISPDQQVPDVVMNGSPSAVLYNGQPYLFFNNTQELLAQTVLGSGNAWSASTISALSSGADVEDVPAAPAAVVFNDSVYLFYADLSQGGQICYWATADGNTWSSGTVPGAASTQTPAAVVYGGQLYVVYQSSASSGQIEYCVSADGTTWAAAVAPPVGGTSATPAAAVFDDQLYLCYQGSGSQAGQLWYSVWDGSQWASETQVAGVGLSQSPSAVVSGSHLYVVYQGADNDGQLWYSTFDGTSWAAGVQVDSGYAVTGSPCAYTSDGTLYAAFAIGGNYFVIVNLLTIGGPGSLELSTSASAQPAVVVFNDQPLVASFGSASGDAWSLVYVNVSTSASDYAELNIVPGMQATRVPALTVTATSSSSQPLGLAQSPSAVVYGGQLYAFYQGSASGAPLCGAYDSENQWATVAQLPDVGITGSPSAAVLDDDLYVFFQPSATSGQLACTVYDGSSWSPDSPVAGVDMTGSPAAVAFDSLLYVFFQGAGSDAGALGYCTWDGTAWSSVLGVPSAAPGGSPSASVFDGTLYVFYEGTTSGQCWYIGFDGTHWSSPVQVTNVSLWGTPSGVVYTPQGQSAAQLFLAHQQAPASGQTSPSGDLYYCPCTAGGTQTNTALAHTAGSATGAPSAVVVNGIPYVFFNNLNSGPLMFTTYTQESGWVADVVPGVSNMAGSPTAQLFDSELYVFYTNGGELWYTKTSDPSDSAGWPAGPTEVVPPPYPSGQAVVLANGDIAITTFNGRIYAFYQGSGNQCGLYSTSFDGSSWSTQIQILENEVYVWGSPAAFVYQGTLYLLYEGAVQDSDLLAYHFQASGDYFYLTSTDGSKWSAPTQVGPLLLSNSPSVVAYDGLFYCLTQDPNSSGELWFSRSMNVTAWSVNVCIAGDGSTSGVMSQSPAGVVFDDWLYAFYQTGGADATGMLAYCRTSGAGWARANLYYNSYAPGTTYMSNTPSAVAFDDKIYVFYQGSGGNGQLWYSALGSSLLSGSDEYGIPMVQVPGVSMSQSPAAVVFDGTLYVFYQGGGNNQTIEYCSSTDGSNWTVGASSKDLSGSDTYYSETTSPAAVVFNGKIYLFYSEGGTSNANVNGNHIGYCTFDGTNWSGSSSFSALILSSPWAAVANNQLYVFYREVSSSSVFGGNQLWYSVSSNGSDWSTPTGCGASSLATGPGGAALSEALAASESVFISTGFTANPFELDF